MSKRGFLAGLMGAAIALAGGARDAEAAKPSGQPIYVDEVSAPATVSAGEVVDVTIEGNMPTPAWEIHNVQIERAAHKVTVTLWCRLKDHSPGIQMLAPVTRKVPIDKLAKGDWTIAVVGHNGTGGEVKVRVH
jgi:hypothetical protein